MNVLPEGSSAPVFNARNLNGDTLTSAVAVARGPLVLAFGRPEIHASRLVVGYLRRLKERLPELAVWLALQGESRAVATYSTGYLDSLTVIHDETLELSRAFAVTHVPTVYYLYLAGEGANKSSAEQDGGRIGRAFTGFSRAAMNALAVLAARASGAEAQELIAASDNKGEYELAERALSN